jgi:hypothetical protein
MKLSAQWQKFYKWYCIVSCLLVAVVWLLIAIGGDVWEIRNEFLFRSAFHLCRILLMAALFGVDLLLWIISVVIKCCRRESASGWALLGYAMLMTVMKILDIGAWVAVTGGV